MILIRVLLLICVVWLIFARGLTIILTAVFELQGRHELVADCRKDMDYFCLLWSGEIV